jgi:hypothetical protein
VCYWSRSWAQRPQRRRRQTGCLGGIAAAEARHCGGQYANVCAEGARYAQHDCGPDRSSAGILDEKSNRWPSIRGRKTAPKPSRRCMRSEGRNERVRDEFQTIYMSRGPCVYASRGSVRRLARRKGQKCCRQEGRSPIELFGATKSTCGSTGDDARLGQVRCDGGTQDRRG